MSAANGRACKLQGFLETSTLTMPYAGSETTGRSATGKERETGPRRKLLSRALIRTPEPDSEDLPDNCKLSCPRFNVVERPAFGNLITWWVTVRRRRTSAPQTVWATVKVVSLKLLVNGDPQRTAELASVLTPAKNRHRSSCEDH